jgi:hypothetical protein
MNPQSPEEVSSDLAPEFQEVEPKKARFLSTNYLNPAIWAQIKGMADTFFASKALPRHILNLPQAVMVLQAGFEVGLKPIESINSIYIVNGTLNFWGKAMIKRLREHKWTISYLEEDDTKCTAVVRRREEKYEETFLFSDAEASGWTKDRSGNLKVGWRKGQNRKLKMRYGVLSAIIKTYIPEVLGPANDIAEIAQDYEIIEVESQEAVPESPKGKRSSLSEFVNEKRRGLREEPKKAKKTKAPGNEKEKVGKEEPAQAALFKKRKEYFAVMKEAGLTAKDAKEHVKDHYKAKSFTELTYENLDEYIKAVRKKKK